MIRTFLFFAGHWYSFWLYVLRVFFFLTWLPNFFSFCRFQNCHFVSCFFVCNQASAFCPYTCRIYTCCCYSMYLPNNFFCQEMVLVASFPGCLLFQVGHCYLLWDLRCLHFLAIENWYLCVSFCCYSRFIVLILCSPMKIFENSDFYVYTQSGGFTNGLCLHRCIFFVVILIF